MTIHNWKLKYFIMGRIIQKGDEIWNFNISIIIFNVQKLPPSYHLHQQELLLPHNEKPLHPSLWYFPHQQKLFLIHGTLSQPLPLKHNIYI